MKTTTVLSLKSKDAENFFMDQRNYHTFQLPPSFKFNEALSFARKAIGDKPFKDCLNDIDGTKSRDRSYVIMFSKDGKYASRPLVLSNPYLYAFLVREVCDAGNWAELKEFFKETELPNIERCAIPVIPDPEEDFHNATSILHWWTSVEQKSVELSLQYRYMLVTDITNCYGSIRQSVLVDAFSLRGTELEHEYQTKWIEQVKELLFHLQNGNTMGIPQGATIYDLVGEIVLAYADVLLAERLEDMGIEDYHVIRYRDDYRIYANSMDETNLIGVALQDVLNELGLTFNSGKTKITDSIIEDSIKPDKLFYQFNTPVYNKKGCDFDSVQKHLLYILQFAQKFPNSGQLCTQLSYLERHIEGEDVEDKDGKPVAIWFHPAQIAPIVAILVDLALKNPKCAIRCISIIGRLMPFLSTDKAREDLLDRVSTKICGHMNTGLVQLWLQQLTMKFDRKKGDFPYAEVLCNLAYWKKDVVIWDNSWVKHELYEGFPNDSLYDETLEPHDGKLSVRNECTYNN